MVFVVYEEKRKTMAKHKHLKDGMGMVYLMTDSCRVVFDYYKYGFTIKPHERKRIQNNNSPVPMYNVAVMFSKNYRGIEKWLKKRFKKDGVYIDEGGGKEWVKSNFSYLFETYKEAMLSFPDAVMCTGGKRYTVKNGTIIVNKHLPNCRLDFLGIRDGDEIKCITDGKVFKVQNNKILVDGNEMSLSGYMNKYHKRPGSTNQHNGYQYFVINKKNGEQRTLYDMWQKLVRCQNQ